MPNAKLAGDCGTGTLAGSPDGLPGNTGGWQPAWEGFQGRRGTSMTERREEEESTVTGAVDLHLHRSVEPAEAAKAVPMSAVSSVSQRQQHPRSKRLLAWSLDLDLDLDLDLNLAGGRQGTAVDRLARGRW
ncbi:hypothetical protein E4U42_004222 [Claviceps africana]|uniref:Uncharacterized protein n=1 Tax=Claviceps africana TaxID=83212 RepID=A0A8K0J5G8_9HYPO|nr:hypothetical protein E4U42_004222 [Claviceps africana]